MNLEMPMVHTGCENWEPLPPCPLVKLLYWTTLTGTDERDGKGFDPTSGWAAGTATMGELFGI